MELRAKQRVVVDALEDVKGHDIVVLDTARLPTMFERVVIASGDSTRQLRALAERVSERIKAAGGRVYGIEGNSNAEWVLVDLGDVVVHIMHPAVRGYYGLEEIWGGRNVRLKTAEGAARKAAAKPKRKAAKAKRPVAKAKRKAPAKRARKAR